MTADLVSEEHTDDDGVKLSSGELVSMKLLQSVYNDVTGKTESISKNLKDNHVIAFEDISQLNHKIIQLYDQYNVVSKNCSVTLYLIDDSKEVFSSFDRFKLYNKSTPNPCENVAIEYSFLIQLPETAKVQTYKITINLHSRAAIKKKSEEDATLPGQFMRFIHRGTGFYKIDYVDYTVARSIRHAIDEWYSTVTKTPASKILNYLQKYSAEFPFLFRLSLTVIVAWNFYALMNAQVIESPTLDAISLLSVIGFCAFIIASNVAFHLGMIAERCVDIYQPLSALKLTTGDEKAIAHYKGSNLKGFLGGLAALLSAIVVSIATTYIIDIFDSFFS